MRAQAALNTARRASADAGGSDEVEQRQCVVRGERAGVDEPYDGCSTWSGCVHVKRGVGRATLTLPVLSVRRQRQPYSARRCSLRDGRSVCALAGLPATKAAQPRANAPTRSAARPFPFTARRHDSAPRRPLAWSVPSNAVAPLTTASSSLLLLHTRYRHSLSIVSPWPRASLLQQQRRGGLRRHPQPSLRKHPNKARLSSDRQLPPPPHAARLEALQPNLPPPPRRQRKRRSTRHRL